MKVAVANFHEQHDVPVNEHPLPSATLRSPARTHTHAHTPPRPATATALAPFDRDPRVPPSVLKRRAEALVSSWVPGRA